MEEKMINEVVEEVVAEKEVKDTFVETLKKYGPVAAGAVVVGTGVGYVVYRFGIKPLAKKLKDKKQHEVKVVEVEN